MSRHRLLLTLLAAASIAISGAAAGLAQSTTTGRNPGSPGGANDNASSSSKPGTSALPSPIPKPPSTPNFPNSLGNTTSWRITPSPGVLPGARSINPTGTLPGFQPLPTTPQPGPADPRMQPFGGYRDVNNPGGATGPFPGWAGSDGPGIVPWDPDGGRNGRNATDRTRDQRHFPPNSYTPTYYLLPYYVPYVVNPTDTTTQTNTPVAPAPYPNQPTQTPGIAAQPLYPQTLPQPGQYGSVTTSTGASTSASTATASLTLAKAYWLEGETIWYETEHGGPTPISIAQLDLTLTQQLNKDRGIKFVLESR
jgi:hypothetical protein